MHLRVQEYQEVNTKDHDLLADLIAFGDGGFFCNRIVTPVFDVMAYEVGGPTMFASMLPRVRHPSSLQEHGTWLHLNTCAAVPFAHTVPLQRKMLG